MTNQKKIVKNTFFLYILTFSNYFLGLLLFPYLSRILSVDDFGLIGFSMSFVLIFQMIVEYGFSISSTGEISENRDNKNSINKIVSTVIWAKILLTFVSVTIYLLLALLIPVVKNNFLIITLFILDSVIKALLPDFYFRGIEEMKIITIRAVIAKLTCIGLAVIFVRGDAQIVFVPIAFIIGDSIALFISLKMMFNKDVNILKPNIAQIKLTLQSSFLFFVSRLSVSLNNAMGSFFLGLKFGPSSFELGNLSGVTKITAAGEMMLTPVSDSIYPHMIKNKDYKLLKKILIFGGIFWLLGCMLVFFNANLFCEILLGKKYSHSGNYLRILLINSFFAFFSIFLGYPALAPIGKSQYANLAIPIATSINVALCTILWMLDEISLVRILMIMSIMNIILVIIRGTYVYKFRNLIKNIKE